MMMRKPLVFDSCPLSGNPCRHCSIEKASGAVTLLKPDIHTKLLVSAGSSFNVMELGAWCNNNSQWVADMDTCPISPTPAPKDFNTDTTVKWVVDNRGDIVNTQRHVKLGQQQLIMM